MMIFQAFGQGLRFVRAHCKYLFLILAVQLLLVIFPGAALKNAIQQSLDNSQKAEALVASFDSDWFSIFSHNAGSLERTFQPAVSGFGALLEPLNQFLTGGLPTVGQLLLGLGFFYLLLWTFFTGGLLSRFQPELPHRGFFASSAYFFWRVLVISVIAGVFYWLLFSQLLPALSGLVEKLVRETVDERVHFVYTLMKYAIIWLLLWTVSLVADYGKIYLVQRNIGNPLSALGQAVAFVFGHPAKTYGLYFLLGIIWIIGAAVYIWLAPGAAHGSWGMILVTFVLGEAFILWRIALRAQFLAAQSALLRLTKE